MARNIGPTTEILLKRIRQAGNSAVTNDFATQILTISQQIVNIALQRVTITETFSTKKEKLLYSMTDFTTPATDILSMVDNNTPVGTELSKCNKLSDLAAYELDWFRNVSSSTRFLAWHQIGRSLFILYPGKSINSYVTVTNVKATTVYDDFTTYYNTAMELPDEDVDIALKVAQLVLTIRQRKPQLLKTEIETIINQIKARRYVHKS